MGQRRGRAPARAGKSWLTGPALAGAAMGLAMVSALSWYTTPEGSRIAMVDTQGDSTGGVIIAWVIISGAKGFLVNPAQFSIDYSHLSPTPATARGLRLRTGHPGSALALAGGPGANGRPVAPGPG